MPLTLVMAYRYESLSTLAMELPTQDPLQLLPSSIQLSQLIRQRKQHQRMQLNASWIVREQLEGRCPDFRKRIQGYVRFLRGNLGILGNDSFLKMKLIPLAQHQLLFLRFIHVMHVTLLARKLIIHGIYLTVRFRKNH